MIDSFVLFVEGVTVVGESVDLVNDFDFIAIILDLGLELEHEVIRIFL